MPAGAAVRTQKRPVPARGAAGPAADRVSRPCPVRPPTRDHRPLTSSASRLHPRKQAVPVASSTCPTPVGEKATVRTAPLDAATLEACVSAAVAAPSIFNTQPWRYRLDPDTVTFEVRAAPERSLRHADPVARALH